MTYCTYRDHAEMKNNVWEPLTNNTHQLYNTLVDRQIHLAVGNEVGFNVSGYVNPQSQQHPHIGP